MTATPPNTLLAAALSADQPAMTLLAQALCAAPRGELVTLPRLGRAWIELAGEEAADRIEAQVYAAMALLQLPLTQLTSLTYDSQRTARTLAWAVRHPVNREQPFGLEEQWLKVDIDLISACGMVYNDVRARLDPVGRPDLTQEEMDAIRMAIEKKNHPLLLSFGVAKLSLYMLGLADQPESSPTPPSSTGPS